MNYTQLKELAGKAQNFSQQLERLKQSMQDKILTLQADLAVVSHIERIFNESGKAIQEEEIDGQGKNLLLSGFAASLPNGNGLKKKVQGMSILEAASEYLAHQPSKTASVNDICDFLHDSGVSKASNKDYVAISLYSAMKRDKSKRVRKVATGTLRLF